MKNNHNKYLQKLPANGHIIENPVLPEFIHRYNHDHCHFGNLHRKGETRGKPILLIKGKGHFTDFIHFNFGIPGTGFAKVLTFITWTNELKSKI
ncbi:MAG TPA: hypothetical protein PKC30_15305 [Saprospiraceae bacterium]|nr:hypothetical protein [Saprospiraceae bacterium]